MSIRRVLTKEVAQKLDSRYPKKSRSPQSKDENIPVTPNFLPHLKYSGIQFESISRSHFHPDVDEHRWERSQDRKATRAKGEADRKANDQADRKAKQEADPKAKEEADCEEKDQADLKAKEEAEALRQEAADTRAFIEATPGYLENRSLLTELERARMRLEDQYSERMRSATP